jgi:hypothetical protein
MFIWMASSDRSLDAPILAQSTPFGGHPPIKDGARSAPPPKAVLRILDNPFGRRTWASVPNNGGPWRWRPFFCDLPPIQIEYLTV